MSDQPKALRLADALDAAPYSSGCTNDAAYELRRLHAEVEALRADAKRWRTYRAAGGDLTLRLHNLRSDQRDAAIDAARGDKK